jgi:RNA polymerase sigma-70 factor (ECF subfamily)
MEQVAAGDQQAFSELYDRHAAIALGIVTRVVGNRQMAEEIVQEAFWRVWKQAETYDATQASFRTWFLVIARRMAIDALRQIQRRPQSADGEQAEIALERTEADTNVAETVERDATRTTVRKALDELSPEQREVLEMAYFKGKTRREIAAETQTPLGTIHTRARLGLQHLRAVLASEGLEGVL